MQQALFESLHVNESPDDVKNWGTFKDSLRAPVHRWFTYPAGFSYRAVQHSIERFDIRKGMTVYDPFMGSGTTNLTCKSLGISSVGIEAHPFVVRITRAKMNWEIDEGETTDFLRKVSARFPASSAAVGTAERQLLDQEFPDLIRKCYPDETLFRLRLLKHALLDSNLSQGVEDFFFVAITALLRETSSAATGWPYIAPNKAKVTSEKKDVLTEFTKLSFRMLDDLARMRRLAIGNSEHRIVEGDSRDTRALIGDGSINHVFTSPPYLNNFDYSDRTRLEMYFWGEAKTWKDISDKVRTKLITSATTQISRSDPRYRLRDEFIKDCPKVTSLLSESIEKLGKLRTTKGGKKSYDLMVTGYFNDVYRIVKDVHRVLAPHSFALFVLGDSAPYGVHIPTDKLIGEIGVNVGFNNFRVEVLRKRGEKWKANPQRHGVSLLESIVILEKKS